MPPRLARDLSLASAASAGSVGSYAYESDDDADDVKPPSFMHKFTQQLDDDIEEVRQCGGSGSVAAPPRLDACLPVEPQPQYRFGGGDTLSLLPVWIRLLGVRMSAFTRHRSLLTCALMLVRVAHLA